MIKYILAFCALASSALAVGPIGGGNNVTDATLTLTDITTNNASTSKHGFLPKLDGNTAHFLDGTGALVSPSITSVKDGTDATKILNFDVSAFATATTRTFAPAPGGNSVSVIADAGVSHQFITGITTAGAITKAQPTVADVTGAVKVITAYKATAQTVNNTAVAADDADLKFAIGANEVWAAKLYLVYTSVSTTPGLRITFTGPASPTAVYFSGIDTGNFSSNTGRKTSFGTVGTFSGMATSDSVEVNLTVINGANAGTVTLQWAQRVANAENTTLEAGSFMVATKLN